MRIPSYSAVQFVAVRKPATSVPIPSVSSQTEAEEFVRKYLTLLNTKETLQVDTPPSRNTNLSDCKLNVTVKDFGGPRRNSGVLLTIAPPEYFTTASDTILPGIEVEMNDDGQVRVRVLSDRTDGRKGVYTITNPDILKIAAIVSENARDEAIYMGHQAEYTSRW